MMIKDVSKTTVLDTIEKSISGQAGLKVVDLEDILDSSRLISRVISYTKGRSLKQDIALTENEAAFFYLAMQVKIFYHPKNKLGKPKMDYNLGLATYLTLVSDLINNDNLEQVVQGRYTEKPLDSLTYSEGSNSLLWNNVGYEHNYSFSIIKLLKISEKEKLYLFAVESERVPETEGKNGQAIETYDTCIVYQDKDLVEVSFEQYRDSQLMMLSKVASFDLSLYMGKPLPMYAFTKG
jgi:hypothetical protein